MPSAVVLNCDLLRWIGEIEPPQHNPGSVVDLPLRLRPRQPSRDKEEPEPGLHRRPGLRLDVVDQSFGDAEIAHPPLRGEVTAQLIDSRDAQMSERVSDDEPFS